MSDNQVAKSFYSFFIVFLYLLSLNSCSTWEPDTKRLVESTSIGATLGGVIALAARVEPTTAIVFGLLLGYNDGLRVNKEINAQYDAIKTLNINIHKIEKSNRLLEKEIKKKENAKETLRLSIRELKNASYLGTRECKNLYGKTIDKIDYTSKEIKKLNLLKEYLYKEIKYIENTDYSYSEQKKLELNRTLYKNIKIYKNILHVIRRRYKAIEDITKECSYE